MQSDPVKHMRAFPQRSDMRRSLSAKAAVEIHAHRNSLIFPEEKEGLLNKTGAKFHNIVEIAG